MITQPYVNFILPTAGGNVKPISNGTIYIGKEGLDQKLGGNPIYYRDNNGTEVGISSPLYLNATGVIVDGPNSSTIINPYTKAPISILILNHNGDVVWSELRDVTSFVSHTELDESLVNYAETFKTVSDMQAADLSSGDYVCTLFYNTEITCRWDIVESNAVLGWYVMLNNGLYAKLRQESGDIRMYGGLDDGTYNNSTALDYLISIRPITIILPKSQEGTGVYHYDATPSSPAADLTGVTIELDEGVSISSTGTTNGPLWRKGVKVNRELKSKVEGANYNLYSSPTQYLKLSENFSRLTASDGNLDVPRLIDFSASYVRAYQLSSWPSGSLNVITPQSATESDINLGSGISNSFKVVGVPVANGDMIQANVAVGTVRPCVFVETSGGWVIVQQPPLGSGQDTRIQIQYSTGASIDYDTEIFNQVEYRFDRAAIGIIVYDSNSFGVVVNGVVVKRIDTTPVGAIQLAGWGAGFDAGTVKITRPSAFYRKKSIGIKPLKIVGIGDSTSAETLPPSQYQYMKQYLSGSCGAQVWDLKNLAVGGNTSAQQLAALQNADISNYDYCCIQVGVNDIQTGAPSLTLLANIESMIDICEAANVTPIVGLPIQWYRQVDAQKYGQDGQNAQNSFLAPAYRNVVMHGLAKRGGVLMNHSVLEDGGAVLAELLSKDSLDPVVQDNIHPSAYGQMAMGMSYAKAIISHATGNSLSNDGVSMPKWWLVGGIGETAQPKMFVDGSNVSIQFYISRDGVTISDGGVIANIPERFRPLSTVITQAYCTQANSELLTSNPSAQLIFHEDGRVIAHNVDNSCVFISVSATYTIA